MRQKDKVKQQYVTISKQKEIEILKGLKRFEKSKDFLDKYFSLSVLAGIINTNTKYLSYILKNHYDKGFSTYINELRINYIIEKLHTDKKYRLYKLSFLAEECGFSSHSKFSAVFKSITGLQPSDYKTKKIGAL